MATQRKSETGSATMRRSERLAKGGRDGRGMPQPQIPNVISVPLKLSERKSDSNLRSLPLEKCQKDGKRKKTASSKDDDSKLEEKPSQKEIIDAIARMVERDDFHIPFPRSPEFLNGVLKDLGNYFGRDFTKRGDVKLWISMATTRGTTDYWKGVELNLQQHLREKAQGSKSYQ